MIDAHSLYLAGLVSQATFALTLTLLAWSDRRTKGISYFAAACAIQFTWTATRAFPLARGQRFSESASSCILVLLFYLIYMGYHWVTERKPLTTRKFPIAVFSSILAVLAVSLWNPVPALAMARIVTLVLGGATIRKLWSTRNSVMLVNARACAVFISVVLLIVGGRLIANQPVERWRADGPETNMTIYGREATVLAVTLLSFSFIALYVSETNRRLQEETRTDSLTGLRNRRAMEEAAAREVGYAANNGSPLALLMLDMDHFKVLNDTWGHALGDRALRSLGTVLLTGTGARDFTARMGGEEFAVLLPGMDMDRAAGVAERLRERVADIWLSEAGARVTVSIGVSVLRTGEFGWSEMLCRADDALYQAKREGRNRVAVCLLGPSPMTPEREAGRRAWRGSRWLPKPGPLL